jgi:hypothetical protein
MPSLKYDRTSGLKALEKMQKDLKGAKKKDEYLKVLSALVDEYYNSPVWARSVPHAGMTSRWYRYVEAKGTAEALCKELGVSAIVFGHDPQEKGIVNVSGRIFGTDIELRGFITIGVKGIIENIVKFAGAEVSTEMLSGEKLSGFVKESIKRAKEKVSAKKSEKKAKKRKTKITKKQRKKKKGPRSGGKSRKMAAVLAGVLGLNEVAEAAEFVMKNEKAGSSWLMLLWILIPVSIVLVGAKILSALRKRKPEVQVTPEAEKPSSTDPETMPYDLDEPKPSPLVLEKMEELKYGNDLATRVNAAKALGRMGLEARWADSDLVVAMGPTEDADLREAAVWAVGEIAASSQRMDQFPRPKQKASEVISWRVSSYVVEEKIMKKLLRYDKDENVRKAASEALVKIGVGAVDKELKEVIIEGLQNFVLTRWRWPEEDDVFDLIEETFDRIIRGRAERYVSRGDSGGVRIVIENMLCNPGPRASEIASDVLINAGERVVPELEKALKEIHLSIDGAELRDNARKNITEILARIKEKSPDKEKDNDSIVMDRAQRALPELLIAMQTLSTRAKEKGKVILAIDDSLGSGWTREKLQDLRKILSRLRERKDELGEFVRNVEIVHGESERLGQSLASMVERGKVKKENVIIITGKENRTIHSKKVGCFSAFEGISTTMFIDDKEMTEGVYYPLIEVIVYTLARALYNTKAEGYRNEILNSYFNLISNVGSLEIYDTVLILKLIPSAKPITADKDLYERIAKLISTAA